MWKVSFLSATIARRKFKWTLSMENGLSQINVANSNAIQDSLLLKSIQQRLLSFKEFDCKKSIMTSRMSMQGKCQKLLIAKSEMIKSIHAFQVMLLLYAESWRLRFRTNKRALIIEEAQTITKDFMQAILRSTASRIRIMRYLETMNKLGEQS